jgi:DHA2 family methylenomycin A resistance protein-like MFS transporter
MRLEFEPRSPNTAPLSANERTAPGSFALYAICFGFFLVLLDTTALNVAIAAMEREFGGAINALQWVVNSYTLVFASLLLVCGAIGDRFGPRRLYQTGLFIFTVMSLACALSPGLGWLIGLRVLQGLGAAMMLPASLSLLSHSFPQAEERGKAVALWASIVSLGFAAGPALGGMLTHFFGWRSIFWLNVPVGILALGMVHHFVKEAVVPNPRHIDWAGQMTASLALLCLTYALIQAGCDGWGAPRIQAAFYLSLILIAIFITIERSSEVPVLPRALFAKPAFTICILVGVVLNFGMYGTLFIESLYLQNNRHLSALASGLMILPFTALPTVTTRLLGNRNNREHIKPRLVIGQILAVLGGAALGLQLIQPGPGPVLLGLGVMGVGMGFMMPAMTAGVLMTAPTHMSGLASGILNSARQTGGVLGVALMGTFVQRQQEHGLLISFGLTSLCFLLMTAATLRHLRHDAMQ